MRKILYALMGTVALTTGCMKHDIADDLMQGRDIVAAVTLPAGYRQGTVGEASPYGTIRVQGPLTLTIEELFVSDGVEEVSFRSMYATCLTTNEMQREPNLAVVAIDATIPQSLQDIGLQYKTQLPSGTLQDGYVAAKVLRKGDAHLAVVNVPNGSVLGGSFTVTNISEQDKADNKALVMVAQTLQKRYDMEEMLTVILPVTAPSTKSSLEPLLSVPTSTIDAGALSSVQKEPVKEARLETLVHVSDATFDKEVLQSSVPVVVDFYATWCPPCKRLAPIFEETSKRYTGKVTFAKMDTDKNKKPDSYNISGIPTLIVFKNGKEVKRHVGFVGQKGLVQFIDDAVK
ncbi:thioredoxin [Candidatus Woesearchaeota archaeon]|nr:thioredoxin [Candidatus Woesearchaeota archaeon]